MLTQELERGAWSLSQNGAHGIKGGKGTVAEQKGHHLWAQGVRFLEST